MKIVPAVLAERENDFFFLIKQAEAFTDYVQIDIMDGFFVPSRSISSAAINRLKTTLDFEVHLMVKHPSAYMTMVDHPRLRKVIYHVESGVEDITFIHQLKDRGLAPGLAIKPGTPIKGFHHLIEHVDTLLFMTVDPGYYGSPFKPEVLDKIKETRSRFHNILIGADGGVSLDNLHLFINAGVDYACVGSRIFLGDNPGDNFRGFLKRIEEEYGQEDSHKVFQPDKE
jgi:ribulose-phosphate 3-epimerase